MDMDYIAKKCRERLAVLEAKYYSLCTERKASKGALKVQRWKVKRDMQILMLIEQLARKATGNIEDADSIDGFHKLVEPVSNRRE